MERRRFKYLKLFSTTFFALLIFFVFFLSPTQAGECPLPAQGNITLSSCVISAGRKVGVGQGNIIIPSGVTLQMENNTELVFEPGYFIRVDGYILKPSRTAIIKKGNFTVGPTYYKLTVDIYKGREYGFGSVISNPPGINCNWDMTINNPLCSTNFPAGSTVTLNAIAGVGSYFSSWDGDCSGTLSSSCTLLMNRDKLVGVRFFPSTNNGTIISCGSGGASLRCDGYNASLGAMVIHYCFERNVAYELRDARVSNKTIAYLGVGPKEGDYYHYTPWPPPPREYCLAPVGSSRLTCHDYLWCPGSR